MKTYQLWINGSWEKAQNGKTSKIENPATGEFIAEVSEADLSDVNKAVLAAEQAFLDGRWSRLSPGQRSNILWKFAELIAEKSELFAKVESENTGKPYKNLSLAGDIPFAIDNLKFFATAARSTAGNHAGEYATGYTSYFRKEPVGVVGQIAPWNYPLLMAIWKIGPALAAGCTVVLKPAPGTPLTTLMLAELSKEAGLHDGVLNIITGGNDAGQAIVDHPKVRMVSLTGSTGTGKKIMQSASQTLKRVHLELGGKAPVLVFEDSDIEFMAGKVAFGATCNSGQDCTAATRVYLEQSIFEKGKEAIVSAMKRVVVGHPFEDATEMGSLISKIHLERVMGFVQRAKTNSANILTGGGVPKGFEKGYFFEPTVISGVAQSDEVVQNEIFGPVLTILPFKSEKEAIQLGNDVNYGLAASVFTKDISRAMRVTQELEFGTVWVNDHLPLASEAPHGGFKQSGFGKDLSIEAMNDYLVTKHIMIGGV